MLKCLRAGGIFALLLPQMAVATPIPVLQIKSATIANRQPGEQVAAGEVIVTGKGGVVTGSFLWGGVKSFSVLPSSTFSLEVYGNRPKGARYTQFRVTNEAYIEVLTVNPNTEVKACFINRWNKVGCSSLKSTIRIAPLPSGEEIVAVAEGNVTVQDEAETTPPVQLVTGEYSILKKNGSFTPAKRFGTKGDRIGLRRSKAIAVFETKPGWRFCNGDVTFQAAISAPLCLKNPTVP